MRRLAFHRESLCLGATVITWLTRNFSLLIGGIILLPLTLFISLMFLAFGAGFSNNPAVSSIKIVAIAASYLLVFTLSVWQAVRSYKKLWQLRLLGFTPNYLLFVGCISNVYPR